VNATRVKLVSLAAAYSALILLAYVTVISRSFDYLGYTYQSPGLLLGGLSVCLAVLPALWLPDAASRLSIVIVWILYLLAYVPGQLIPVLVIPRPIAAVPWMLGLLPSFWLVWRAVANAPRHRVGAIGSSTFFWLVVLGTVMIAYVSALALGTLELGVPDLGEAYVARFLYRAETAQSGVLFAYLISWTGNVINPLFMSHAIIKRRVWWFLIGLGGQIALFSLSGFKSVLFSPLLVIGLHLAMRRDGRRLGSNVLIAGIAVVGASIVSSVFVGNDFLMYLFTRRMVVTPGLLSAYYVEFFSVNPQTMFANSFLSGLVDPRYTLDVSFLIGETYFNDPTTSANANVWADGFAGLGIAGMVLVSALLGLALRALDAVVEPAERRLFLGVAGVMGFTLANAALSTSLLSHGFLFALALAVIAPWSLRENSTSPNQWVLASSQP
jgi:hypothetical protein